MHNSARVNKWLDASNRDTWSKLDPIRYFSEGGEKRGELLPPRSGEANSPAETGREHGMAAACLPIPNDFKS